MEHELKSIIPDDVIKHLDTMEFRVDSKNCLEAIQSLLQSSVLVGGKRLRPLLTLLMGHLFRLDLKLIQPYAKAVELVHAASLSHDDVIDNATLRRGKPSINVLASNKKAVLAGDTLLSLTIVELAECQNHFALELVKEMSYVIRDLSEGEWLQSDFIQERNYTLSKIKTIADKKTASVMGYCSVAPAFVFLGEYLKRNSLLLEERDTKLLDLSKTFG